MLTSEDDIYEVGLKTGVWFPCGRGERMPSWTWKPRKVGALSQKKVIKLAFGNINTHALALTKSGLVYEWGQKDGLSISQPSLVQGPLQGKIVTSIACGACHSLVLTNEGEVFSWGENECGQMCDGTTTFAHTPKKITYKPTSQNPDSFVVQVACGGHHSMILLNSGEVFSWGINEKGQLGLGHKRSELMLPTHVNALESVFIEKIACGYSFTLALSKCGRLYGWGENRWGQLGTGDTKDYDTPRRIAKTCGKFTDIAAFPDYDKAVAFCGSTQTCFVWGLCGTDESDQYKLKSVLEPMETPHKSIPEAYFFSWRWNDVAYPGPVEVTPKDLKCEPSKPRTLKDSFRLAFNNSKTSNVKFLVDGQELHAHKDVLMIRCEHFINLFKECWKNDGNTIKINDISYSVYKAFLYYLYTDEVELTSTEDAIELLDLANAYFEAELKNRCVEFLIEAIDLENAAMVCAASIKYELIDLEKMSMKFFFDNLADVVKTEAFSKLDAGMCKSILAKAGALKVHKN